MRRKSLKLLPLVSLMTIAMTMTAIPVSADNTITGNALVIDKGSSNGEQSLVPSDKLSQVNKDGFGTITITLTEGAPNTKLEGVQFSCLQVGDVVDGEYELYNEYTTLGVNMSQIRSADDLEEAAKKIADSAGTGTTQTTDINGKTVFSDLGVGLYLLEATDTKTYDDVTPTLVSIPTWSEKEGNMMYDLTIIPKHQARQGEEGQGGQYPVTAPQTNVESHIPLYFGGAAVLLVVLVVMNIFGRKKQRKEN